MPKNKPRTEKQITAGIRNVLYRINCWHWKHWGGPMSKPGVSDILGIWNGRFLAIEIKTEKGKLTIHQDRFLREVNENGGLGFVARSEDDVIKGLGVEDRFLC